MHVIQVSFLKFWLPLKGPLDFFVCLHLFVFICLLWVMGVVGREFLCLVLWVVGGEETPQTYTKDTSFVYAMHSGCTLIFVCIVHKQTYWGRFPPNTQGSFVA